MLQRSTVHHCSDVSKNRFDLNSTIRQHSDMRVVKINGCNTVRDFFYFFFILTPFNVEKYLTNLCQRRHIEFLWQKRLCNCCCCKYCDVTDWGGVGATESRQDGIQCKQHTSAVIVNQSIASRSSHCWVISWTCKCMLTTSQCCYLLCVVVTQSICLQIFKYLL